MAVYISMGVPAQYLLAASIMAAPAALVISKIVIPETQESETKGEVKLEVKKAHSNIMDAISHGAGDGLKVSLNVIAMLIGVIALIALIDYLLGKLGIFIFSYTFLIQLNTYQLPFCDSLSRHNRLYCHFSFPFYIYF